MPRIEPIKLLKCLSGCLSLNGGIKSRENVETLVKLMTKYSKKLVSKCIYIQVLKYTETELLGLFMGSGGWCTIHMWLTESIAAKNWPLVRELLELLLLCPVNIERLKTNNCPKLVKELSKDGNDLAIRALASKLVEQWLKTVKGGENVAPIHISEIPQIVANASLQFNDSSVKNENIEVEVNTSGIADHKLSNTEDAATKTEDPKKIEHENKDNLNDDCKIYSKSLSDEIKDDGKKESLPVLKITVKDGKQIISKVNDGEKKVSSKSKHKDKTERSSSSSKSSSSSSKHSSRSSEKHRSSSKSSNHRNSSPSKHRSKDTEKDRNKDREKEKSTSNSSSSKHKHSDSKKSSSKSSSSSRDDKRRSIESKHKKEDKPKVDPSSQNDKPAEKPDPPSIHKLGRIPRIDDTKKEKHSISIEVRKPDEPKPKTVKTFHSKFRKHGLEEEIKPPPSRASVLNKKPTPVVPPTVSIPKRSSPIHNETPPEKKIKIIEPLEKPGSIKLIPAKPKPMLLQESDMFMDALNASATNKKEPKKRKRRISSSKDGNPSDSSPPTTPTNVTSPSAEPKIAPLRFYQDTLDADDEKEKDTEKESIKNDEVENKKSPPGSPTKDVDDQDEPHTLTINGLKGVLCYHKRKGPKKSIRWKPDIELEEIQYFELDETERVNVTKTFTDMKYLERIHERDAFQKGRNLANDDVMEEKTLWRALIAIDVEGQIPVDYGKSSKEKEIQAVRQKGTLQPLYFHKSMIPDSPLEPDVETHTYSEPVTIPLEDVTGNQDNISDFRNMPWPEPKGTAPITSTNLNVPPLFPQNLPQFPNNFGTPQFPMVPGFQSTSIPGDWPNSVPQILPNGMPSSGPLPPGIMPPGGIAPGLMVPPETILMGPGGPDMFNGPNPMFAPGMPEGFNMMDNMNGLNMPHGNMFSNDFNMQGGQMANGNDMYPGPGNFRGAMRGRGSGHWRGKGPGNWDGPPRGRGGAHARGGNNSRKAVCIYFQRKGSCRQGDNCTFLHPGVNCPF